MGAEDNNDMNIQLMKQALIKLTSLGPGAEYCCLDSALLNRETSRLKVNTLHGYPDGEALSNEEE